MRLGAGKGKNVPAYDLVGGWMGGQSRGLEMMRGTGRNRAVRVRGEGVF